MLLAAAVDLSEDGGREENNKYVTKVEKVDTETLIYIWVTLEPLVVENWYLRFWNPQHEQKLFIKNNP